MNALSKTVTAGIVATIAMTMLMMVGPLMGLPKMDVAAMLGSMLGGVIIPGWAMHFAIGITFALLYLFLLNNRLKIENNILRGAVYGLIVFVFAQIAMAGMSAMGIMPAAHQGDMALMITGSVMGHLLYGAVLGLFFSRVTTESRTRLA